MRYKLTFSPVLSLLVFANFFVPQAFAVSKINIKDSGAKGDGLTDDTQAIVYAINNADTTIIPNGVFLVSKQLQFLGLNNKTIIADGVGAIVKNNNNLTGTLKFQKGRNISITGGTWTREALPQKEGKGDEHTFFFVDIKNLEVKGVVINGSPEMGIAMIAVVNGVNKYFVHWI